GGLRRHRRPSGGGGGVPGQAPAHLHRPLTTWVTGHPPPTRWSVAVVSHRPRGRGRAARLPGTPAWPARRRAAPRTWATGPDRVPAGNAITRPPPPPGRPPRSAGPRSPARSVAAPPGYLITPPAAPWTREAPPRPDGNSAICPTRPGSPWRAPRHSRSTR